MATMVNELLRSNKCTISSGKNIVNSINSSLYNLLTLMGPYENAAVMGNPIDLNKYPLTRLAEAHRNFKPITRCLVNYLQSEAKHRKLKSIDPFFTPNWEKNPFKSGDSPEGEMMMGYWTNAFAFRAVSRGRDETEWGPATDPPKEIPNCPKMNRNSPTCLFGLDSSGKSSYPICRCAVIPLKGNGTSVVALTIEANKKLKKWK